MKKIQQFNKLQLKNDLPDIRPGDTIQVYQRILPVQVVGEKSKSNKKKEEVKEKEKIQIFEGLVLARKHGKGINATITVRKVSNGFGIEKIFPIHSPLVQKIELIRRSKVRRAKLYYLREAKGKRARLKAIDLPEPSSAEATAGQSKKPAEVTKEKLKAEEKPEIKTKPEVEKKPASAEAIAGQNEKPEVKIKPESEEKPVESDKNSGLEKKQ